MKMLMVAFALSLLSFTEVGAQSRPPGYPERVRPRVPARPEFGELRDIAPTPSRVHRPGESHRGIEGLPGKDDLRPLVPTFRASVVVENGSAQTIKSVSWSVSLVRPGSGELVRRYEVTSDKQIRPGATRKLTERLPYPRGRVVRVAPGGEVAEDAAEVVTAITRVTYADGSSADTP